MTAGTLTLVALESEPRAAAAIRTAAVGDITLLGVVADMPALLAAASKHHPALVVLDLGQAGADVSAAVRSVLACTPESCVVVTGNDATPAVISRAVSAGARTFILRPFTPDDLAAMLREAHANMADLRRMQRGEAPGQRQRGSVIAVYSPKGGVGCTTLATNLAVALARQPKTKVAIVDLDLQFGDVGVALDLRGANSIVDLAANGEAIGHEVVDEVFLRHVSGVRALIAPENLGSIETVDPARVVHVLDALRAQFNYIVCDLWSSLDELTLATLRIADRVVIVTTPELPALKNVRRAIAATAPLLNDERTLIVVNRYPGKAGVSVGDVEKNLGRPVAATLPSEGVGVTEAINQGISLFDSRARSRSGKSYMKLAEVLTRDGPRRAQAAVSTTARV
ncbi:MAG TPA: AAA family ATPase [Candidatus Acidoferrales bacterium]|nr:AAA family ATPase [Candidatus Acidoferrales bacterium]